MDGEESNIIDIKKISPNEKASTKNIPHSWIHATNRGVDKMPIYLDDLDRRKYLDLLSEAVERFDVSVHCWCLMQNHNHLLLWNNQDHLPEFMHLINFKYSRFFNDKYDRDGPVCYDNYGATSVYDEEHLHNTFDYIHNNPSDGVCDDYVKSYRWSSYRAYSGEARTPSWLTTGFFKSYFANRPTEKFQNTFGYEMFPYLQILQNIDKICHEQDVLDALNKRNELIKLKIYLSREFGFVPYKLIKKYYSLNGDSVARHHYSRFKAILASEMQKVELVFRLTERLQLLQQGYEKKIRWNGGGLRKYA